MIAESKLRDDLDEVTQVHKPERVHISVEMPVQTKTDLFYSTYIYKNYNAKDRIYFSPDHYNVIPFVFFFNNEKRIENMDEKFMRRQNDFDSNSMDLLRILNE